ncbi:tandem-95 repeat protein [Candidatus Bipolaricaulota bacterium]|nr:tandem-95 repeat protein [Candidatus Bipolaricaulota bacterium]
MNQNFKKRSLVLTLALVLLVGFTFTSLARPRSELESLATSEAVPGLVQEAAVEALAEVYVRSDLSLEELEAIATGDEVNLREAAIPALVKKYGDVSEISTREKAQEKAKEIRKKAVSGETEAIKEAAGKSLANFFVSFNLSGVEGYSTEELEAIGPITSAEGEFSGLKLAVTEALSSIYPNEKSVEELKTLIKETDNAMVRQAAYQALAVRYSSPLAPSMELEELQKMAENEELSAGERKAAGIAFGEMAAEKMDAEELIDLSKNGSTRELRKGAGVAAGQALIDSTIKGESDLLEMYEKSQKYTNGFEHAITNALSYKLEGHPEVSSDSYSLEEDKSINVKAPGVLANDSDPDGDKLYAELIDKPSNGTVTLESKGSFVYEPDADYAGDDHFTYKVTDKTFDSGVARVELTVKPVNDPPVAADDEVTLDEDGTTTVNVLANDSDIDDETLTLESVSKPDHGTAEVSDEGSIVYQPNENYNGKDTFTYKVVDPQGASAEGAVDVTVKPVNDPPVAADDEVTINLADRFSKELDLLANDDDPEEDKIILVSTTSFSEGHLEIINKETGTVKFVSNTTLGEFTVTYTVKDEEGLTSKGKVTVNVVHNTN